MAKILIIDDDRSVRDALELAFSRQEFQVLTAAAAEAGFESWKTEQPDLVFLDVGLPDRDGIELLKEAKSNGLTAAVIIITGQQELDLAIEAMKSGAFDYVAKPLNIDELEIVVERALKHDLDRRKLALVADLSTARAGDKIVGQSRAVIDIHKKIGLASRGNATVLIVGESGTGKELVARSIHRHTASSEPFIPVNCTALPETLIESELFGHEKGAFTGAVDSKPGRFELAGAGTIFLDEIGDLAPAVQAKLLRVLQERTFERVGGRKTLTFSGRIIAATHRNLEEMVRQQIFREDLYYRLKVIEIFLPPLRERKVDIPPLVEHLLVKINRELRRPVDQVDQDTMDALMHYDWPGNIRELENRLTAAVMLSPGPALQVELPRKPEQRLHTDSTAPSLPRDHWDQTLEEIEKQHIARVLEACQGNLGQTCEVLGISRPTLRRKMAAYHLKTD